MPTKSEIENGVRECCEWWIARRRQKLEEQLHHTMAVNPFLVPILYDFHGLNDVGELAQLLMAAHLMTGHNTGFGKLVDEKILPKVFGTTKLSPANRARMKLEDACFDEIDHLVAGNKLLSLKASKWTIQLSMAVQLDHAFAKILHDKEYGYEQIVVGVFYGSASPH